MTILAVHFTFWEIRSFTGVVILLLACGKFSLMHLSLVKLERDLHNYLAFVHLV